LSVDHATLLEPFPSCRCLVEVVARPILRRPIRQMRRDIDVQFVCDGVDVGMCFVPIQAATRSRAVGFVHVVEDRLRGLEVFAVTCDIVYGDPASINQSHRTV